GAAQAARGGARGGRGRRRAVGWGLWGLATAAPGGLAFLGGHYFWPAPLKASAEAIIRDAKRTHDLNLDRCYLVQSVPEPNSVLTHYPRLAQRRETLLWTRGDRFWVRSAY